MLRGRWLAGHIVVVVLVASFVALGFWQLRRDSHKQAKVRAAKASYAAPAPELETGFSPRAGTRVQATGRFDQTHEFLLRNQTRGSKIGDDVLTPLVLADGSMVIVDRGWVETGLADRPPTFAPPTSGTVVVRGVAQSSSALTADDSVRNAGNHLALPRVDLGRLSQEVNAQLRDVWIRAQAQIPIAASKDAPQLPQPPPPDQVNHLQYALEWFGFALIPVFGWPIVLLRVARRRRPGSA